MAHHRIRLRAETLRAWLWGMGWLVLLVAALAPGATPLRAQTLDLVPDGAMQTWVAMEQDGYDSAIARWNAFAPLKALLIPEKVILQHVRGDIRRETRTSMLGFQYGLSDTWNLRLELPQVSLIQRSTLTSVDVSADAAVAALQSLEESGAGDPRLLSLHRPVFSDRNALVLGWGLQTPGASQQTPFVGHQTFSTGLPFPRLHLMLQYSHFPNLGHARFDLNIRGMAAQSTEVEVEGGVKKTAVSGNRMEFSLHWWQEIGPVGLGIALAQQLSGNSAIGKDRIADGEEVQNLRLEMGLGSMTALETDSSTFPYQGLFWYEKTLEGVNTPLHARVGVLLSVYF